MHTELRMAVIMEPITRYRRGKGVLDHAGLRQVEPALAGRDWRAGTFYVAEILIACVLRLVDRFAGPAGHAAFRGANPS